MRRVDVGPSPGDLAPALAQHLTAWLSKSIALTATFSALADPTRRAVLARLARGPATVGELAAPHAMSLPAVTKHVGVLVDAGLVRRRKEGRTVVCSLAPEGLAEAEAWVQDLTSFWDATLDRLEQVVTDKETS